MAEMGLGYGSEFQLMRFLGHHRDELNMMIQNATGMFNDVKWLDYPYEDRKSGDGEFKGIECFEHLSNYADIKKQWERFWPSGKGVMNWDGIFTINDTWFFVEAKANIEEAFQPCKATGQASKKRIDSAFEETKQMLGAEGNAVEWRETNCYQLANRLAFACFCKKNHIKAKLLYISFLNGYKKNGKGVKTVEAWREVWNKQYDILKITEEQLNGIVYHIYPDCRQ